MSLVTAVLEAEAIARSVTSTEEVPVVELAVAAEAVDAASAEVFEALATRYVRPSNGIKAPPANLLAKRKHHLEAALQASTGTTRSKQQYTETLQRASAATKAQEWSQRAREASILVERRKWKAAAECLHTLGSELEAQHPPHFPEDLFLALREYISSKRAACLARIVSRFRSKLSWSKSPQQISLQIDVADRENFQEVLNALFVSGRIDCEISRFADFFVASVAPMLILERCRVTSEDEAGVVKLTIRSSGERNGPEDVSRVVNDLVRFFETVQSNVDCKWEDRRSVFSIFGRIAAVHFFSVLMEEYLEKCVPADAEETESRFRNVAEIEKFGDYLCDVGFVEEDANPLSKYAARYCGLIYDKKCERLLSNSRDLMKDSLQKDIIKVCDGRMFEVDTNEIKMLEKYVHDRDLLMYPFLMSECCVSSSAKRLLEIIFTELENMQSFPIKLSNQIVLTISNILDLYYSFVSQFHDKSLKTDPLDLALFYNNCFYLAHGIVGYIWNKISSKEYAIYVNMQLCDEIHSIRLSAILQFSSFIKSEQLCIETATSSSALGHLEESHDIKTSGEVLIYNCFNRFKSLQHHWNNILSTDHCEKALLELLNCLSKELVQCVMTVKEGPIGERLANDLSSIFTLVVKDVPSLFNKNMDVKSLSRNYSRLVEMATLLKCPMFAVANRWTENNEMSKLFTSDEIKHFIIIVFPSSKQKSTVLNMIK